MLGQELAHRAYVLAKGQEVELPGAQATRQICKCAKCSSACGPRTSVGICVWQNIKLETASRHCGEQRRKIKRQLR